VPPRAQDASHVDHHALAFSTWQDLTEAQGLDDKGAAELMLGLIAASD
jgi:hypothetical protein